MKISNKLKLALLAVLAIIVLVACSGQAEVDLNNYVAFNYACSSRATATRR